jgi:hypothetical protein
LLEWMLSTYEVTPDVAQRDLLALLSKLADLGLIGVQHAKPPSVAQSPAC